MPNWGNGCCITLVYNACYMKYYLQSDFEAMRKAKWTELMNQIQPDLAVSMNNNTQILSIHKH